LVEQILLQPLGCVKPIVRAQSLWSGPIAPSPHPSGRTWSPILVHQRNRINPPAIVYLSW